MTYREYRERFNQGKINKNLTPLVYAYGIAKLSNLDEEYELNSTIADAQLESSAALMSTFPVCGVYSVIVKWKLIEHVYPGDGAFLEIYDSTSGIDIDNHANLNLRRKISFFVDDSPAQSIYANKYDGSHVSTTFIPVTSIVWDTWYHTRITRYSGKYVIEIWNENLTEWSSGKWSFDVSTINETNNPDFLIFGNLSNSLVDFSFENHRSDIRLNLISVRYDKRATNYSNDAQFSNKDIIGV
jgi:hypothetical protein